MKKIIASILAFFSLGSAAETTEPTATAAAAAAVSEYTVISGDYFFVFTLDMGILGAGLATAMGISMAVFMMLTHFRSPINTMHFVKVPRRAPYR